MVIRIDGCEEQICSVMLSMTADGNKLPPYVLFKCKTIPNIKSAGIGTRANEKGWMDKTLLVDWITRVWGN